MRNPNEAHSNREGPPELPKSLSKKVELRVKQWETSMMREQLERMRDTSNTQGIVLSLLLTLTFTSSLQPPGGWDDDTTGWVSLSSSSLVKLFAFFNSVSFCFAMSGLSLYAYAGTLFVKPKRVVFDAEVDGLDESYVLKAVQWNAKVFVDLWKFAMALSDLIRWCVYISLLTTFAAFTCVVVASVTNVNTTAKMVVYVPMIVLAPFVLFCIWILYAPSRNYNLLAPLTTLATLIRKHCCPKPLQSDIDDR